MFTTARAGRNQAPFIGGRGGTGGLWLATAPSLGNLTVGALALRLDGHGGLGFGRRRRLVLAAAAGRRGLGGRRDGGGLGITRGGCLVLAPAGGRRRLALGRSSTRRGAGGECSGGGSERQSGRRNEVERAHRPPPRDRHAGPTLTVERTEGVTLPSGRHGRGEVPGQPPAARAAPAADRAGPHGSAENAHP